MLIDVFMRLVAKYPDAKWISERRLKQERFMNGMGKKWHVSDGILILSCGKKIAIELELTLKGKTRLEQILRGYRMMFDLKEVWYFCPKELIDSLSAFTNKLPFIKVFSLDELLHGQS